MFHSAYVVKTRYENSITIRYPRTVVLAWYREYGDDFPFMGGMRVGDIVQHVEETPAIVRKRILSAGGYDITLEFLPAPTTAKLPPWVVNPRPRVQIEPFIPASYAAAGGASEF